MPRDREARTGEQRPSSGFIKAREGHREEKKNPEHGEKKGKTRASANKPNTETKRENTEEGASIQPAAPRAFITIVFVLSEGTTEQKEEREHKKTTDTGERLRANSQIKKRAEPGGEKLKQRRGSRVGGTALPYRHLRLQAAEARN